MSTPTAAAETKPRKLKVATASLSGCFGCHMSFLDIDERILQLLEHVEFDRSPVTDIKEFGRCDIGIIEGSLCNAENVRVLREMREHCKFLVALGACAVNGGLPALRNQLDLEVVLNGVYRDNNTVIPNDPELPLLLDKVYPVSEVVMIDYFVPGCPPSNEAIWKFLTDVLENRMPRLENELLRFD